ncbi:MAG: hypothetical protein KDD24_04155 [Flavobacteriales bacterium]|nr:hypothetical protein [Flavobacteriales bacterium]
MIKLYDVLENLSKEESRNLTIFLNRTNAHSDRKDVALFDYIRKNKVHIDEQQILSKLYNNSIDKNSFYRLKNRLLTEVNKSLLLLHFGKNEYINTLNVITLSKVFIEKSNYTIAFEYLIQAEQKATKNEFFDLLDLIYSDLIKLSYESVEFNPIEFIEKRKKNHKSLHVLQEIDDLLAALMYRIKISQNYSTHNYQFTDVLQKTINEFIDNDEVKKSPTLQFKIYHSISRILLQHRDYVSLEDYLKLTYSDFIQRGLFNKSNHDSKLQMLTYLVNSLFKNNKIEESLEATNNLYAAMSEFDSFLFNKYLFYYYNSLVINYQVSDKQKAIEVLLEAKTKTEIQQLPFYTIFIYLNLAVLYFDTSDFKNTRKNLAKLKLSDHFKSMDNVFRLKVNVVELLTFYELGDIDLFDYQLNIIQKDFKDVLSKDDYNREKQFIEIVSKMETWSEVEAKQKANSFYELTPENTLSDNDIINYNEWLKGKL